MSELKFRAWDKLNKVMCLPEDEFCISSTGKGAMLYDCIYGDHDYMDELELLQYTGLKDKNGLEIYEGDIIEHVGFPSKHYTAKFDMIFGLRFIDSGEYYVLPISPVNRPQTSIEIIGNIYENPELL